MIVFPQLQFRVIISQNVLGSNVPPLLRCYCCATAVARLKTKSFRETYEDTDFQFRDLPTNPSGISTVLPATTLIRAPTMPASTNALGPSQPKTATWCARAAPYFADLSDSDRQSAISSGSRLPEHRRANLRTEL